MIYPLIVMAIGITIVIGLIMGLRVNAFIALLSAAMVVSLLAVDVNPSTGSVFLASNAISRVAEEFGSSCGKIAIVIALASVIGTCMMDSGAADRIVRAFMNLLGVKRAPWALMGSGYLLSIPVFFDTVFYLLVPLARSFQKRTGAAYLKCIIAIAAGGAVTHTLVPPTPGPLAIAANLGVDLGKMIIIGAITAVPASIVGFWFAGLMDRILKIPMRELPGTEEREPLRDDQLPGLFVSLLPVVLPVALIAMQTVTSTITERELLWKGEQLSVERGSTLESDVQAMIAEAKANNREMPRTDALKAIRQSTLKKIQSDPSSANFWISLDHYAQIFGNPNLALLLSAVIALAVYIRQQAPTTEKLVSTVEHSLMSGGVIVLITASGSAFGAMLKVAQVGDSIKMMFGGSAQGLTILFLAFGIAALLKVAQGSSTAAMIITSGMMPGMITGSELPFDLVYLATAIGAGSLFGSWMNDSGFWVFAKMGGLTEREALATWTPLLALLGLTSMVVTVIFAIALPLK
jgi:GntP family gluconate:H+ symporter